MFVADFPVRTFRIEVHGTTPHFELGILELSDAANDFEFNPTLAGPISRFAGISKLFALMDTNRFMQATYISETDQKHGENQDIVSWFAVFGSIHVQQHIKLQPVPTRRPRGQRRSSTSDKSAAGEKRAVVVCIRFSTSWWDLLPPDVTISLASTSLGTLITIAHRMGMV